MVVVADTSPLNYLLLINEITVLPALYRRILIPQAVLDEMNHPLSPPVVKRFASAPPDWLETVATQSGALLAAGKTMPRLDAGEVAAIALAANHPDALLLMDEAAGRAEAARRGIHVTGTLGILRDAASAGLVDLSSAFAKLKATSFRAPAGLIDAILDPQ